MERTPTISVNKKSAKGGLVVLEVDVNAKAADFASTSHSTSLPKAPGYRRLERDIPVLWEGNAGLPHRGSGKAGAAVGAVGCG